MHATPQILTAGEFRRFAELVHRQTGIFLAEHKLGLLSNRLRGRLKALRLGSFAEYYGKFRSAAFRDEELPLFLSAVTTNETYFFRNERLWALFEKKVVPDLVSRSNAEGRALRVWSAACSSGEEAYTVAILLKELLPEPPRWNLSILGSDISGKVLEKARAGIYGDYAISRTTPQRVARWFDRDGANYRVKDEIRKLVRFQFHNLRDRFPGPPCDLVLLRNVLMYFDTPMKKLAVATAVDAVASGGYLYVGDVDPLRTTRELAGAMPLEPGSPGLYHRSAGTPAEPRVRT